MSASSYILAGDGGKRNAALRYRAGSASTGFLQLTGCSWGCVLPCIFIPAVSLCSAPVSSEMSLIRKVSEKAVYKVILFGFSFLLSLLLTRLPSTCQLQNEYSYNAEKQENSLEQKIFQVFRKLLFSSTTVPTSLQSSLQADLVGYLHSGTDLGGVRLPESLGCPIAEVHWCLVCHG